MRDLVGDTLSNRYRLIGRVAGGGMGEVYRGHDLLLDRTVAVKVLQPSLAADPVLVERFRAEARAAARLSHPNVVAVHDWGSEDEATYYMVMEYVPGTDLRNVLVGRGILEPAQGVEIVASLCDALAASHSQGLVHRDVKPENVLIARDGTVKVADFGIAVVADADRTGPGGVVPGTLRYLAPEQAAGRAATPASDLWAAGAVLAECLTGRPPVQGTGGDLLRRRASEPPQPPSSLIPGIPTELDDVVLRACALDPADRFRDATEMADALRRAAWRSLPEADPVHSLLEDVTGEIRLPGLDPTSSTRHRKPRRRRRTMVKVAGLVLAVVVVAAGGVRALGSFSAERDVPVPELVGLSLDAARETAERAGLDVQVTKRLRDPEAPKNEVLHQAPAGGVVDEGGRIRIVVSAGPVRYPVPVVTGFTVGNAAVFLRGRAMSVGDVEDVYSTEPIGIVVDQSPATGWLRWGAAVDLVVSKGPQPVTVPDVAGLTRDKAVKKLENAGFDTATSESYSNDVAEGLVIETRPAAGAQASEGGVVEVVVSLGPQFEKLKMPDVRGKSSSSARAILESLGLRVKIERSCEGGDTVVDTEPLPGTTVRENDLVRLFVC